MICPICEQDTITIQDKNYNKEGLRYKTSCDNCFTTIIIFIENEHLRKFKEGQLP